VIKFTDCKWGQEGVRQGAEGGATSDIPQTGGVVYYVGVPACARLAMKRRVLASSGDDWARTSGRLHEARVCVLRVERGGAAGIL
jgi:hypothetical protein